MWAHSHVNALSPPQGEGTSGLPSPTGRVSLHSRGARGEGLFPEELATKRADRRQFYFLTLSQFIDQIDGLLQLPLGSSTLLSGHLKLG